MTAVTDRVRAAAIPVRPPHRRWPWVLAFSLVLALVGAAGYVAYFTPLLGLKRIEVSSAAGAVADDVNGSVTAAVDIAADTPLLRIDLAAVRSRVMAIPQVSRASVSRHWPNALLVEVTQRKPAAVTMANGSLYLLDTTGFPYSKVAKADVPAGLLTVELATPGATDPATVAALAVIGEVKPPIRSTVGSVTARSPFGVTLNLHDGRSVIWGSPDDGARKMQILPALLAQPGKIYDISDPTIVTVRAK